MSGLYLHIMAGILLLGMLFFLSLTIAASLRLSRVSLRAMAEKQEPSPRLLEAVAEDRPMFLQPLETAVEMVHVAFTLLLLFFFLRLEIAYVWLWTFFVSVTVGALIRQLIPKLMVQIEAEGVLLRCLKVLSPAYRPLRWLSWPLSSALKRNKEYRQRIQPLIENDDEAGEEEIQAYLDVGAEDGIFEVNETKLIQSALEFGNTLVREIMTPRSDISAVEDTATIGQLRELFVTSKHSRLPVHHEGLDTIIGVVYIRKFLSYLEEVDDNDPITPLIDEAYFVPETKKVTELLKELQINAGNLAIVINEFGGVAGLVTTEDLVEEIVGEIHDEDEQMVAELEASEDGSYVVSGGLEINVLKELLGVNLSHPDVTTVAGLVVTELGRVPLPAETVELNGVSVTVLEADQRRITKLRVRRRVDSQEDPGPTPESDGSPSAAEPPSGG